MLVLSIKMCNPRSKVFVVGVLPRPSYNAIAQPKVRDFNRFLAASVKKMQKHIDRLFYLPVQLHFQSEG